MNIRTGRPVVNVLRIRDKIVCEMRVRNWTIWLAAAAMLSPATAAWGQGSDRFVEVRAQWSGDEAGPGDRRVLAIVLDVNDGYHLNVDKAQVTDKFRMSTATQVVVKSSPDGLTTGAVQYPKAHMVETKYAGGQTPAFDGQVVLYLPVKVESGAATGPAKLDLQVKVQACDADLCYMPARIKLAAQLNVVSQSAVDAGLAQPIFAGYKPAAPIREAPIEIKAEPDDAPPAGLLVMLLGAFVGGFLLNLTPCVLPVIPLKIMGLSQSAGNPGRCLLLGVAMSAGVVAFWVVLGAVVAGVAEVTSTSQLFQYPASSIGVGVVIALMAVGMCGLFTVRLPQWVYRITPSQETAAGSFGFGVMTAVLSTPCTAPFMGTAASWAVTQTAAVTLTTFAAIGAGMALPYLILAARPQWVERMPKAGPASELIKQVMGLLMLAAAAFFIGIGVCTLLKQPGQPTSLMYWWPVVGLCAAAGVWMMVRSRRRSIIVMGLIVIVLSGYAGLRLTERSEINWVYYTPQRFAAARAQGKTIVLDFTAEWCLNCKAIEKVVLNRRAVVLALNGENVAAMKVDLTDESDKASAAKLAETGRLMIPLLVVYAPDGRELFKEHGYTAGQVIDAIELGLSSPTASR